MRKRIFSIMLVMMMAAQQYVFAETVSDTGQDDYKTLYSEDFEDDTVGATSITTDAVKAALTNATVAEEDGGNNYMKLSGGRYTYTFSAGAMAGDKLTVSFRFQQPEQADNNNLFELQETDDATYATLMKTSGGKLIFDSTEICEVAAAEWHSVKLQYDFEAGTVAVKVDSNDSRTVEIPFGSEYYLTTEQKDEICRWGFRGTTYIDDISIESTPEHWTNQIDEIEGTMALEKEIAPNVVYTTEATEEFNAVISNARTAVTSAETIAELNTAVSGLDAALVKYRNSGTNRALTTIFNGGTITEGAVSGWSTTKGTVTGVADDTKGFAAKLDGTSDVARLVHDTAYDGSSKNYLAKVSFMQTNKSTVEEVLSVHANGSENDSGISFTTNVFSIGTDGTNIIIKCNNSVDGHKDTTTTSWDKVSGRKIATIVSDYSVNTWYDIAVEMDADSRKLTVLVNGEPVLTDLYFIGTNTNFAKLRVGCRVNSGRGIAYFAGVGLYSDDAKDAMVSFPSDIEELSAIFAGRTGYEDVIAGTTFVETTSSGSTVTWTSENEYITQIGTDWYTTFPAGPKAEDAAAVMKATITRGSLSTTKNFELPVKAAYRGEVLNADFNVDDNTTLASLGFKKANNNDAVVSGGKAKFAASTRTLYNVSQEKRTADEEIVEFTFNQPTKGEIAQIIEINDSTGNSIGPKIVSNGTNLTVNTGDTVNATIVKNYEAGKDYKIKIVINFPERTYSVYVDGALEASAIDLEYRVRNIGRLSFANGTCTEFYIDDLKVYTNKKMSVDVSYISDGVDVTGTALNGLTSVSANVTLYNERDEATDGITAYLAVYEDGRLTAVTLAKPEWKGKDGTIALEAVTVGDGDEVKCMVWNNMMPLTSAEVLKKKLIPDAAYIALGQSNMVFRGGYSDTLASDSNGNILFTYTNYGSDDIGTIEETELCYDWKYATKIDYCRNSWKAAETDNGCVGLGPQYSFAENMVTYSGETVGMINGALGGQSISAFEKGTVLYERAVKLALAAKRAGVEIKGIIWHQGENQTGSSQTEQANNYADTLTRIMTDLRNDIGEPDLPVVVGELGHYLDGNTKYPNYSTVQAQINSMPQKLSNCKVVSAEELSHRGDGLHMNSESYDIFGARFAVAMNELLNVQSSTND